MKVKIKDDQSGQKKDCEKLVTIKKSGKAGDLKISVAKGIAVSQAITDAKNQALALAPSTSSENLFSHFTNPQKAFTPLASFTSLPFNKDPVRLSYASKYCNPLALGSQFSVTRSLQNNFSSSTMNSCQFESAMQRMQENTILYDSLNNQQSSTTVRPSMQDSSVSNTINLSQTVAGAQPMEENGTFDDLLHNQEPLNTTQPSMKNNSCSNVNLEQLVSDAQTVEENTMQVSLPPVQPSLEIVNSDKSANTQRFSIPAPPSVQNSPNNLVKTQQFLPSTHTEASNTASSVIMSDKKTLYSQDCLKKGVKRKAEEMENKVTNSGNNKTTNSGNKTTNSGNNNKINARNNKITDSGNNNNINAGNNKITDSGNNKATNPGDIKTTNLGNNKTKNSGNNKATNSGNNKTTNSGDNMITNSGNNKTTNSGDNMTTNSGNKTTNSGDNKTTDSGNSGNQKKNKKKQRLISRKLKKFYKNKIRNFPATKNPKPFMCAIVEEQYPNVPPLTSVHLGIIRNVIKERIDQLPFGVFVPKFIHSFIKDGVILVECANNNSKTWLKHVIENYNPEEGVRLKVIPPEAINQYYPASIFIDDEVNAINALRRMQKQNSDISIRNWQYISMITEENIPGITINVGIPASSLAQLKEKNFKLFHALDQVSVIMQVLVPL